jgi:hypothetical protein
VIREELTRLFTWQERHRRLAARLIIAFAATLVVLGVGSVLIWIFESGKKGGDICRRRVNPVPVPAAENGPLSLIVGSDQCGGLG